MKQNYSGLGDKSPTGQSLSRFIDARLGNFAHILQTRVISAQNTLESAYGGWHHGSHFAYFEQKLRSRRTRNQITRRP